MCLTLTLVLVAQAAIGLTMKEAVELAMSNDPTFLAAQANLNVSRERSKQAVAGLFPQITASANTTSNQRKYDLHSDPPPPNTPTERYNSNSAQLNLTQPLWRHNSVIAMTQADLAVSQADFQLIAAAQELLVRLSQSWFDTMQARDSVQAAAAQVRTARQQLDLSQRAHDKGILSLTDLEDARAKHEQALAEHAMAQSELEIRLAALEQIIGPVQLTPPMLSEQYPSPQMGAEPLEHWLAQAGTDNPALLAARRALDAANEEVRKQKAGHEPTLDLVATYSNTAQAAGITGREFGFDSRQSTIGLQLNMPLYAGGGQSAKVREALALKDKAMQELEAARRQARMSVKEAWYTWRAGMVRETSARQAMQSAELNRRGAQSARERGIKADIDVLQAEQQLAIAQRDWRKARYDIILSRIKLDAACGQLDADRVVALDVAFSDRVEE